MARVLSSFHCHELNAIKVSPHKTYILLYMWALTPEITIIFFVLSTTENICYARIFTRFNFLYFDLIITICSHLRL